jgi:hypothetical protein
MMRLDAGVRIDPTNDRLTVNYNAAGATVVTLTQGLYRSLAELLAHLQVRLRAVIHASMTCTQSSGTVTISWTGGVSTTITWTHTALRDWLGYSGTSVTATTSTTASNVADGVFVATLPWEDPAPAGWRVSLMRARHQHGAPRSFRRALRRRFEVTARVRDSETLQFRGVLRQFLRGYPGTLYRDTMVTDPWAWDEPWGAVTVQLDQDEYSDEWQDARRDVLIVPLTFLEESL